MSARSDQQLSFRVASRTVFIGCFAWIRIAAISNAGSFVGGRHRVDEVEFTGLAFHPARAERQISDVSIATKCSGTIKNEFFESVTC